MSKGKYNCVPTTPPNTNLTLATKGQNLGSVKANTHADKLTLEQSGKKL